jgi:hypothetical protein
LSDILDYDPVDDPNAYGISDNSYLSDAAYNDATSYDPSYYTNLASPDLGALLTQALGGDFSGVTDLTQIPGILNFTSPTLDTSSLMMGGTLPTSVFDGMNLVPFQDTYTDMDNAYSQATGLPLDQHVVNLNGQDYILDEQGNIVGYLDETGQNEYYSDIANAAVQDESGVKSSGSGGKSALQRLAEAQATNALQKYQAQQNAQNSGLGRGLAAASAALMMAQALRNNPTAKVSKRDSTVANIKTGATGSKAPLTLYRKN